MANFGGIGKQLKRSKKKTAKKLIKLKIMDKNKELSFEVEKEFEVPVKELYKAWIDPKSLKQWWKPMGNLLTKVENDVTPGGSVLYEAGVEGEEPILLIKGKYEKVIDDELLVYSWNFNLPKNAVEDSLYKLEVKFSETSNGSRIHVNQKNLMDEEALVVHREGWEKGLQDLKSYLSSKS